MKNSENIDGRLPRRTRGDKFFLLSWKRILIIICAWVLSLILHNVIYGLFKEFFDRTNTDEPAFFILAVFIIPLYFIISLAYTAVKKIREP
jgi:hypothetical protein